MIFNSLEFALFLPLIFFLYWFVAKKSIAYQNFLLLVASLYFYGCWNWKFLFLLSFSILVGYSTGLLIEKSTTRPSRRFWFWLSIILNVGFLGLFKYYNFFIASFAELLSRQGLNVDPNSWTLNVILPVGISFYTFHVISYVVDIYYGRIRSERNVVYFGLFVAYFPLLVAGPIERATHLLPQLKRERNFDYAKSVDGLRQILWGLFKKVIVADGCAEWANLYFNGSAAGTSYPGSALFLGAIFFTFQIYCDFSGYSDIALGTSRLFGIELLRNFAFPYFSRDIAEFWRRWHISLTTWFRDYLYIPLGGSKGGIAMKIRNTFIIFLVSGFWHGANWTFLVWGALNAFYFIPLMLLNRNRNHLEIVAKGKTLPSLREVFAMISTFLMVVFGWIFFRANDMSHAVNIIKGIFNFSLFSAPRLQESAYLTIFFIVFSTIVEWRGRESQYALEAFGLKWYAPLRWLFYAILIACILVLSGVEQHFIYFQF
jgi:D-alanyl-lipoteichoic acid acyltransferase DltB (MBOAT superfamily)